MQEKNPRESLRNINLTYSEQWHCTFGLEALHRLHSTRPVGRRWVESVWWVAYIRFAVSQMFCCCCEIGLTCAHKLNRMNVKKYTDTYGTLKTENKKIRNEGVIEKKS
jgi:hypothetical protein